MGHDVWLLLSEFFVIYFFITWFPTYLVRARGFTLLKIGYIRHDSGTFRHPLRLSRWLRFGLSLRRGLKLTSGQENPDRDWNDGRVQ